MASKSKDCSSSYSFYCLLGVKNKSSFFYFYIFPKKKKNQTIGIVIFQQKRPIEIKTARNDNINLKKKKKPEKRQEDLNNACSISFLMILNISTRQSELKKGLLMKLRTRYQVMFGTDLTVLLS